MVDTLLDKKNELLTFMLNIILSKFESSSVVYSIIYELTPTGASQVNRGVRDVI